VAHGAHAAAGLALLAASPWPGTHRQSLADVLAVCVVFLEAGQVVQAGLLKFVSPPGEKVPCAQTRQSTPCGTLASFVFKLVEARRKSSSDKIVFHMYSLESCQALDWVES